MCFAWWWIAIPTSEHYQTLWQQHFYEGLHSVVERLVLPDQIDYG